MSTPAAFIPFDQLPNHRRVWVGSPGSWEEGLGKLRLLTEDVVAAAAKTEIKTGRRVTMNWELPKLEYANYGRKPCQHHIVPILHGHAFDDIYILNPQQSSQWDGLRHFSQPQTVGKPDERVFYGGTTAREILDKRSERIGMQFWGKEGIAGRGVLIDYASWAEKQGIKYSTFSNYEIRLRDIHQIATECDIHFQPGDLLFIRLGVTKEWNTQMTAEDKLAYSNNPDPEHAGVEATVDVLRWVWDNQFSAVAGDMISWEVYPARDSELFLHEYFLAGWGLPIGELFDLEALAVTCKELKRWSFFFTSAPFNMPGGVSSPSNAMAIF